MVAQSQRGSQHELEVLGELKGQLQQSQWLRAQQLLDVQALQDVPRPLVDFLNGNHPLALGQPVNASHLQGWRDPIGDDDCLVDVDLQVD